MQTKVLYLSDLKFNLETWRRELRFHFNEMDSFQEKLEEIASREYKRESSIPLESFQNRIMIEKNVISKLSHRCKAKMRAISLVKDRKSTRLNSSHKPISYAVFCLKKKKTNNNQYIIKKYTI